MGEQKLVTEASNPLAIRKPSQVTYLEHAVSESLWIFRIFELVGLLQLGSIEMLLDIRVNLTHLPVR